MLRVVPGFFLVLLLLLTQESFAHPQYVRLGYFQCASCHYNPMGSGLLQPYGKGVAYGESFFEKEIEEPEPSRMQHGLQSRFAFLKTQIKSEAFLMQLDYQNRTELTPTLSANTTLGLTSPRAKKAGRAGNGALGEWAILRDLYLRYQLSEGDSLEFGRTALPIGILTDDHTLYIRSKTRHSVTDYPTQLRYTTGDEKRVLTYYAYLPSYEEDDDNREYGLGARTEFRAGETFSVGITGNYGATETLVRYSIAPFARLGFTSDLAVLAQLDLTAREVRTTDESFVQKIYFLKPVYSFGKGIELGYVLEKLDVSGIAPLDVFQHGISYSMRIVGSLSLLGDYRWTIQDNLTSDRLIIQAYLHI